MSARIHFTAVEPSIQKILRFNFLLVRQLGHGIYQPLNDRAWG
jgi:hypothetical protein